MVPSTVDFVVNVSFTPAKTADQSVFTPDKSQALVLGLAEGQSAAILGAAGTGKTRTLIELIAARVAGGLAPHQILTLSPHRLAATRLRNAIAQRLNIASKGAMARTPSSLAFALASEHALSIGEDLPTLLTGSEQDAIIADLLAGHLDEGGGPVWPEPLVPEVRARRAFRSELRDLWSRATEHGWTPEDLARIARSQNRPEWAAAATFWEEYRGIIASFRTSAYDSAELLSLAAAALSNPEVMPEVKLVLVDDAQELTYGAVRILRAFAARGVPVIALGDPDISSTTFRGALPHLLGRFATELNLDSSRVTTIVLEQVHRHGPDIRQVVQRVTEMGSAEAGLQRRATSILPRAEEDGVHALERPSQLTEVTAVARLLREFHVKEGIEWSRMAVVARTGSFVPKLARALAVTEVPTRSLLSERSLREHPAALDLITAITVATGREELTAAVANQLLLSPMVGMTILDLRRLRLALRHDELAAGGTRTGEEALLAALENPGDLLTLDFAPARRAARFAQTLQQLREESATGATIEELLWTAWDRSGLAKVWGEDALSSGLIADDANRNLDGVMALFTSAKRFVERFPERPATDFIASLLEADVPEDTLAPQAHSDAVLVCTPSAVIGAEFDVVAVMGLQENLWPNLRPRGSLLHAQELNAESETAAPAVDSAEQRAMDRKSVLDDELRMFALATSRARTHLLLSAQANDDTLPSVFLRKAVGKKVPTDAIPQADLTEYPLTLRGLTGSLRRALTLALRDGSSAHAPETYATALSRLAHEKVPGASTASWYGLTEPSTNLPLADLTDPDVTVSVSPSKLETWKKNQLAWFIESIVGRTSSNAQGIGTIVHTVMEDAGNNPDAPMDAQTLMSQVDARWHELSFDAEWLSAAERRRVDKMMKALAEYLRDFKHDGKNLLASEGGFELRVGHATVRGFIDRVEQDVHGEVMIVDLKTGKSFPAGKDIPEHSQLACYQLALTEGALDEVPEGAKNGGAKLLYVTDGLHKKLYRQIVQEPYDEEAIAAIKARIDEAAVGMAGSTFTSTVAIREEKGDPHSRYEYRIHIAQAVSAS